MAERIFENVDNYIYAYHLNQFLVLPVYPETISDNLQVYFTPTTPLARSAPIQSYSSSGPRTVNFRLLLHRDLMNQINYEASNIIKPKNDDYLDTVINCIQALSVPEYTDPAKMVNPPFVAVRIGDQIFIKGIMSNAQLTYQLPLIDTKHGKKYAVADISFTITETEAYTASYIAEHGSFRGLSESLERKIASYAGGNSALSLNEIATNRTVYNVGTNYSGGGRRY